MPRNITQEEENVPWAEVDWNRWDQGSEDDEEEDVWDNFRGGDEFSNKMLDIPQVEFISISREQYLDGVHSLQYFLKVTPTPRSLS